MTVFPNLFVLGAMKSATTSLCTYLDQHPEIFMSPEKEPFYFLDGDDLCDERGLLLRPDKGKTPIPGYIGSGEFASRKAYLKLFSQGSGFRYRAEGSPLYLPDPNAACRIAKMSPGSKLVMVLRNPIHRAYSAYTFQRSFNREPQPTFSGALNDELAGNRDNWWYGWRYIYTGQYARQIERYLNYFEPNQLLVLEFEEFKLSPHDTLKGVFKFLDINEDVSVDTDHQSNITRMKSPLVTAAFQKLYFQNPVKTAIKKITPISLRKRGNSFIRRAFENTGTRPSPMMNEDHQMLAEIFAPEVRDLEQLLGRKFSKWK